MKTKGLELGKIFFNSFLKTLEEFLQFDEEITEDFLNIKEDVVQEILQVKNDKQEELNLRRSKRKIKTPIRYGYDE